MADFLWHKVSEKEKGEIEKQAKEIMEQFSKKLSKIGDISEVVIEREEGERQEAEPLATTSPKRGQSKEKKGDVECLELDREIMFENAPNKNRDFIVGERKRWG